MARVKMRRVENLGTTGGNAVTGEANVNFVYTRPSTNPAPVMKLSFVIEDNSLEGSYEPAKSVTVYGLETIKTLYAILGQMLNCYNIPPKDGQDEDRS